VAAAALAVSLAVWVAAAIANARASRAVVAGLPVEWREHPELRASYAASARTDYLASLARLAPWLAAAVAWFVTLGALDVLTVVQVAAALVGGAWWAARLRSESHARARAVAERDGLAMPERIPGWLAYVATLYLLCLAIALSTCFAGQALWALAG
jgi:hypothetical protein